MAQRNLPSAMARQVTNVVAKNETDLLNVAADIGAQVLRENEEAKIARNFSDLQAELSQMEMAYKTEFLDDPTKGFNEFKKRRQGVIDNFASDISPLYRGQWNESVRKLTSSSDITQQKWVVNQTRKNSVRYVNDTINNGINQAMRDGMTAGQSEENDIDAFANFANSFQNISSFATKNLGEAQSQQVLKNYEGDYIKSFVSGVGSNNPARALDLLDTDDVKNAFDDPEQYLKMKSSMENKLLNTVKVNQQNEIINVLRDENNILSQSMERQLSYSELENAISKGNYSNNAKNYFYKINGFKAPSKEGGAKKLSDSEKMQAELDLYDQIVKLQSIENPDAEEIAALQDNVYAALDADAITNSKAMSYLNGILAPSVDKKEAYLAQFDIGEKNVFGGEFFTFGSDQGLGFSGLQEAIDSASTGLQLKEDGTPYQNAVNERAMRHNNQRKLDLYNFYYDELESAASARGIQVGQLQDLPRPERREVYTEAQNNAKFNFWSSVYPEAGFIKENAPQTIVTSTGEKIKTGISNGQPSGTVSISTKVMVDANGNKAVVEVDGDGNPIRVIREID